MKDFLAAFLKPFKTLFSLYFKAEMNVIAFKGEKPSTAFMQPRLCRPDIYTLYTKEKFTIAEGFLLLLFFLSVKKKQVY